MCRCGFDLAKTDADKQAMKACACLASKPDGRFSFPPACRPNRVAALRRAFDATLKDPALHR